jgi:hypothetical protein
MALFDNFPLSYKYLITIIKIMLFKEFTMEYSTRLMYEASNKKEKSSQGDDATKVLCQGYKANTFSQKDVKIFYYCSKLSHITQFCYKIKNKDKENANMAYGDDNYTFAIQDGVHYKAICK